METKKDFPDNHKREAEVSFLKRHYAAWIVGILVFLGLFILSYVLSGFDNALGRTLDELRITLMISFFAILIVWYGLIRFWHHNFLVDKENEKNKNPFRNMFFGSVNVISLVLLAAGLFISFVIMSDEKFFLAIASFIAVVWTVIFLRYFMWSVYFYNINYGLTDSDWARIFAKRDDGVTPSSEINAPKQNPYHDQTFGLPSGTVRGMIAFTLLFGGLALLLASMDMTSEISGDSYYADHFEFFKNAFLMMIAFYFGDSSMKHLTKDWNKSKAEPQNSSSSGADEVQNDLDNAVTEKQSIISKATAKKKALQNPKAGEAADGESLFE